VADAVDPQQQQQALLKEHHEWQHQQVKTT